MKINANLFYLIDQLIIYEKEFGIKFDSNGFPIFEKWMFVDQLPKEIIPYDHRLSAKEKNNTIVCFYEKDSSLYRHLTKDRLFKVANELNNFKGFVGYDISIFIDFLRPFQEFYILANLVIDIFFIINGNKVIPNLRSDETDGASYFYLFKEAPIVCVGTLGCSKYSTIRKKNKELIINYSAENNEQLLIQYGSELVQASNALFYKSFRRASYE